MTNPPRHYAHLALAGLFAASLTACGGGEGGSQPAAAAPAPAPAALAAISGVVADGPLSGALVCYDTNSNNQCDSGEPASAPTDADGRYRFEIDPALAGRHRVVAMVPANAVDKDTGSAVGTAFTLLAPASGTSGSQTVFVSPLTTLVQTQIDVSGWSAEKAAAFVQGQAGLEMSPLADFTAGSNAAQRQAATVARLALLSLNQRVASLSGVIGQTDISGGSVTADELRQVVARDLLGVLTAVAAVANADAVRNSTTPAAREAALAQGAQVVSSTHLALDAERAKAVVGIAKMAPDTSAESPAPTGSLVALRYLDANNWFYRATLSTTADNTPDGNGELRYYDQRSQRVAGQQSTWGYTGLPERTGDLHWTGNAWLACPFGSRSTYTPSDASGRSSYSYCNNQETGSRTRSMIDIAGRSLRSVVETVRQFPGGISGVDFADWGPADLNLLGAATMPSGSRLAYQTNAVYSVEVTYDSRASAEVGGFPLAIGAGGDARNGASPPCVNNAGTFGPVRSLGDLVGRYPGSPCIFNANANTGARNEAWGLSTINIGTVNDVLVPPEGTGSFYTRNAIVRAGFVAGSNGVNFYSCLQRASDGSARNCDLIGTGTFRIETLGDALVLHFDNLPELALRLSYKRVFVERGGKVFFGFQSMAGRSFSSVRLNLPATNALFAQLGLPLLQPVD